MAAGSLALPSRSSDIEMIWRGGDMADDRLVWGDEGIGPAGSPPDPALWGMR